MAAVPVTTADMTLALVTVTLGRHDHLSALLTSARRQAQPFSEVIVVFNGCDESFVEGIRTAFPEIQGVVVPQNLGAVARSLGMEAASSDIVVTIDDDVTFLDADTTPRIRAALEADLSIGAVAFRVVDPAGAVCNWAFRRDPAVWATRTFEAPTFPGGAVAFRRSVLERTGLYPMNFFISGEEDDLAVRVIDAGSRIVYVPSITVEHGFAATGRPSWRRDYYDLRNTIWFAVRHYPAAAALSLVLRRTAILGYGAIRRGNALWLLRALRDAAAGLPLAFRERRVLSREAQARLRALKGGRL